MRTALRAAIIAALLLTPMSPAHATARVVDVALENALPGSPNWRLSSKAFTGKTLAYADQVSVLPGESVGLFVQCRARSFAVQALRIGYYDGAGARRVWGNPETPCQRQSAPRVTAATRMAEANWKRTLDIDTTDWPEGMYVLKVRADDGSGTYVNLVLRSAEAQDRVLFVSSTLTFQAYNDWGGANAYRGKRGYRSRARVVSFDRPQTWGQGSGKFLGYEAPLLQRAERLGLPLAYTTDVDITADPTVVEGAASIVFGGHAEYWTQTQRDAVLRARAAGSNLLFFGANTAYWRVRLASNEFGPRRLMAVYKSRSQDPDDEQPTIRFRDLGMAESKLTGVTYSCFPVRGSLTIANAAAWVFDGTGVRNGDRFPGIVGPEVDKLVEKTAADNVLANSKATCGKRTTHATMLLRRAPSGAMTFASGTMGWVSKVLKGGAPAESVRLVRMVTDNLLLAATNRGLRSS